jgi:hypothetical protein
MKHDPKRDRQNYRACVDILDPHNGIGALCDMDLIETPMSVMLQGARAADEIRELRRAIDEIEAFVKDGPALEIIGKLRERQEARAEETAARAAAYAARDGDPLGLRVVAEIEEASDPSVADLTRTIRDDAGLSSRVADFLDTNVSLAQAALDSKAISPTTWINIASMVKSIDTLSASITWSDAQQAELERLTAILRIAVQIQLGVLGASFAEAIFDKE